MTSPLAPLRDQMKQIEKSIPAEERRVATNALVDVGADFLASTGRKTVAGFFPVGHQITPLLLLNALHLRQMMLALPKSTGDGKICFYKWSPGDKMAMDERQQPCPADCSKEISPDYLLVPTLGFDRLGNRLGYGEGFYQRAISLARANRQAMIIGISFVEQELDRNMEEANEGRLDWIMTPQGLHGFTQ